MQALKPESEGKFDSYGKKYIIIEEKILFVHIPSMGLENPGSEALRPKIDAVKEREEVINYEGLKQAKIDYANNLYKERGAYLEKTQYDMTNGEVPTMRNVLTSIIDNCSLNPKTKDFVINGTGKLPKWLFDLKADPDMSPAARHLRRLHQKIFEGKTLNEDKVTGYTGLYRIICNLNSAFDLKPYLAQRQREGTYEGSQGGSRDMRYTERILRQKPKDNPEKVVKKTYTELPKPTLEKPEVLRIGQDWLHDDARVNESQFDQKKIDYVAIGKKIAQGKNFTFLVSAGVDRRPVRITSRPIVDKNYKEAEENMDTMLNGKQKENLCDKYYPMMVNAKNIGEQYNMKLLLARTMAPVKQIHEKIFAPYLATISGDASKKAFETQRLISMIQIGELRVGVKTNKNLQQDRYTNLTA